MKMHHVNGFSCPQMIVSLVSGVLFRSCFYWPFITVLMFTVTSMVNSNYSPDNCMPIHRVRLKYKPTWLIRVGGVPIGINWRRCSIIQFYLNVLRVIDRRHRAETAIREKPFAFTPGRGTTDAIFAARESIGRSGRNGLSWMSVIRRRPTIECRIGRFGGVRWRKDARK